MYDWEVKSFSLDLEEFEKNFYKNRGIDDIQTYINPSDPVKLINSFSTDLIENIKISKQLIFESIQKKLPIIIHGDYDADGVIATSIIFTTIKKVLNYQNVSYIIPDRFEDGYGLSDKTTEKILSKFPNQTFLLITVDCGITSVSQVSRLRELGNRVIITDHHHHGEEMPMADSIIWSDEVVGSVLSWFLSLSLGNKDPRMLSLASIATVTDVFPLKGFNRSILKKGLSILRSNPPKAIKILAKNQGIDLDKLDVYHLGFVIGPRLNSSGRVSDASFSTKLLLSESEEDIKNLLSEINLLNQRRQEYTEESLNKYILDKSNLPNIIVIYDDSFHEGVVGLIASKFVQTYHRPALIISKNHDVLKGSARSIKGINIIDILKIHSNLFIGCGGHELAAGFSLKEENLNELKDSLNLFIEKNYNKSIFIKKLKIDSEIPFSLINFDLLSLIEKFEPFGQDNEEPIFLTKNFRIFEIKKIGSQKNHLSLLLEFGEKKFKAVYFSFPKELEEEIYLGQKVDIVYKIKKNFFNNKINLDLNILDMRING